MNDTLLSRARQSFSKLVMSQSSRTVMAGRYAQDADKEAAIWDDIVDKLGLGSIRSGARILDIGCGVGPITDRIIEQAVSASAHLTLVDFPEVIDALLSMQKSSVQSALVSQTRLVRLVRGSFPHEMPVGFVDHERFDLILMYSVIHYTTRPIDLIRAAVALLAPKGRLLVGDVPNLSKKGRFLSSQWGREWDAKYKGIPLSQAPHYRDHFEFIESVSNDPGVSPITDDLIHQVLIENRRAGLDAYVIPQNPSLPFSFTREDLLIQKHD